MGERIRMLKGYLVPLFGWLPQGEVVELPAPVAEAMVVNRYAERVVPEPPATRWSQSRAARVNVKVEEPPAQEKTPGAGGDE